MWYAIQVMTGEEMEAILLCFKVLSAPNDVFSDFFTPLYDRRIKRRGKWSTVRRVLFPGYIFVETDFPEEAFLELKGVPSLTKLLGTGFDFVPLSQRECSFIRRVTDKNHVATVSVGFIEGDRVTITEGPMMGLEGLVRKIDRHKRTATLEVEMMGRVMPVVMGLEIVSKG